MMPIVSAAEPITFNNNVRIPGNTFLKNVPLPSEKEWNSNAFWQRSLPDMRNLYGSLCAYCSTWIPHSTGAHSIDHFKAKSEFPKLAYEWKNFRYVSSRFNSRKGLRKIVDPFKMKFHWFEIDFSTYFIFPRIGSLSRTQLRLAGDTIKYLRLNDDDSLVEERQSYYEMYFTMEVNFDFIQRMSPFLAFEIDRQGLRNVFIQ